MKYNIKAIPTKYAGVMFRSRLEARWAAFFDLIGWKWEYEPFDLNGWAPDFRITMTTGKSALVEVKPVSTGSSEEELLRAFSKCEHYYWRSSELILFLGFELNDNHMGWTFRGKGEEIVGVQPLIKIGIKIERQWIKAGNIVRWKPSNRKSTNS